MDKGRDFWKYFWQIDRFGRYEWNQRRQHFRKSSSARTQWLKKGSCVGISKGGKTTKIHLTTDKKGRPVRINLSAGNVNDSLLFEEQISGTNLEGAIVLADRAYSTYEIIESLKAKGAIICIPPKSNMKYSWFYDKKLYKSRNKIERFFQFLKNNRRIATRYDRLDNTFTSFIYFSSIIFWLK